MNRQQLERIEAMDNLKNKILEDIFSHFGEVGSNIYSENVASIGEIKDIIYKTFKKLAHEEVDKL